MLQGIGARFSAVPFHELSVKDRIYLSEQGRQALEANGIAMPADGRVHIVSKFDHAAAGDVRVEIRPEGSRDLVEFSALRNGNDWEIRELDEAPLSVRA